jgi:DNA polymerase-3 subunit epsilon
MQTNLSFSENEFPLKLIRPLAFLDIESTGVNVGADRIVELSIVKIFPGGKSEVKSQRFNPTIPIPPGASKVHGIKDEDIKDAPTFAQSAKELARYLDDCDLAGYNSNKFDIPMLVEEFMRAGIDFDVTNKKLVDVQNIFHKMEQRTLVAAYKFYCGKELVKAHSAEADTLATFEVLLAQIARYKELKNDVAFLHEFSNAGNNADLAGRIGYNEKGEEVFNFGKHKDRPVSEVFRTEPSYYDWMMKGDFPQQTKKVITAIRLRAMNTKK